MPFAPQLRHLTRASLLAALAAAALSAGAQEQAPQAPSGLDESVFREVPAQYRPTVSTDDGAGYNAPLEEAARRAILELDAGGIMFNPQGDPARERPMDMAAIARLPLGLLDRYPEGASPWLPKALPGEARFGSYLADASAGPGKPASLGFMTRQWFDTARKMLELAHQHGRTATYYDEAGFPSGGADHTIPPKFFRKLLRREEMTLSGSQTYELKLAANPGLVALLALDARTGERIDLAALARDGLVQWRAPMGRWRIQKYSVITAAAAGSRIDYYGAADYLDAEASRWFIEHSYERVERELAPQFKGTVKFTFFDDVGIFPEEKTWHPAIAARFERITGRPATLYYPALWEDIGPETAAARVGFFKARAELLGETFPRLITEWAHAHGVQSTGHAPGTYALQPTDMVGDPFKFHAHTDVPMVDALWGLGHARGGFKIISAVAAERDLPLAAVEAFSVNNSDNGYRRTIELLVRGINHFVTGARQPSKPRGTSADFNRWAGRASYLLQGGRHVADIAVLYPVESLQAFYAFDTPDNPAQLPNGMHVYRDADYQAVGEMLLTSLHRDFCFVHPDALAGDKLQVRGRALELQNEVNREQFRAIVLPGGEVVSAAALAKVRAFYDAGGSVIATSLLPSRSAEFGRDAEVQAQVQAMFGAPADARAPQPAVRRNAQGGQAVFIAKPSPKALDAALTGLGLAADVALRGRPVPTSGNGVFGYLHKRREGKDIYFFGNSSDTRIDTKVTLRGRITELQWWNPHDGSVTAVTGARYRKAAGGTVTDFDLALPPIATLFVVGKGAAP